MDLKKQWSFQPEGKLKVGSYVSGGDIIGKCFENNLFEEHRILLPPRAKGKITWITPEGDYTVREKVMEVEFGGKKYEYSLSHFWPVREPRPFADKLVGDMPLLTG